MISIPICGEQTGNELKLQPLNPSPHWSHWRRWGCPTPVWGHRRLICFNLPKDLVLERLSLLNLLRDPPAQWSQEVIMRQPAQGPNSQEADLPRPAQGFDLQEAVMPQLAWGSAP